MRLVCISDTHRRHEALTIPDGDVLVHAGDIGIERELRHLAQFNQWLGRQPHKHKVIIPGNHDLWIERNQSLAIDMVTNGSLLIDDQIIIEGVKFYGSPWQPEFCNWAWNLPRGELLRTIWEEIPLDTDVLITHGPPRNILDHCLIGGRREGCDDLLERVQVVKPKVHIFGHIHESYGQQEKFGIKFINAASVDFDYYPVNQPIVVDI